MNNAQSQKTTGKTLVLVVLIAIVTAVVVTLVQRWILGKANIAVTGGLVGGVTAVLVMGAMRKKAG
jgi:multisubunit Na+/H+ antiporter MnhB subunit